MKKDLASSIGVAIVGAIIAYFICNLFIGPIEDVTLKTVDSSVSADLVEPNPELFNYKALNPTVEVYVGNCSEFNSADECIEENKDEENNTEETNNQGEE